jgi:hypothetical protein
MLANIDHYLQDTAAGFGRIDLGQVPNGSGQTIVSQTPADLSGYFFLAGRSGGQTAIGGISVADALSLSSSSTQNNPGCALTLNSSGPVASISDPASYSGGGGIHEILRLNFNANGANSAAFTMVNTNTSSTVFQVDAKGNTNSSGYIQANAHLLSTGSRVNLTGQTGSIGSTNLISPSPNGDSFYRVSFYFVTTTAGNPGDVVKATLGWFDGFSQTLDVPLSGAATLFNNHDLGTLGAHSQGSVVVNSLTTHQITYTTTVTKTGTPQYEIHVRIEALG